MVRTPSTIPISQLTVRVDGKGITDHVDIIFLLLPDVPETVYLDKRGHF